MCFKEALGTVSTDSFFFVSIEKIFFLNATQCCDSLHYVTMC